MKLRFSQINTDEPQFEVFDGIRNITITKDLYESLQLPDGALPLDPAADLKSIKINGTNAGITISPELLQKNETEKSNIVKLVLNDHSDIDNVVFDPNKKYEIVFNFDPKGVEAVNKLADEVIKEELLKGTDIYRLTFTDNSTFDPLSFLWLEGLEPITKLPKLRSLHVFGTTDILSLGAFSVDELIVDGTLSEARTIYNASTEARHDIISSSALNVDVAIYANDGIDLPIALPEMTKEEFINYNFISGKRYIITLTPELLEVIQSGEPSYGEANNILFDDIANKINATGAKIVKVVLKDGITKVPSSVFLNYRRREFLEVDLPASVTSFEANSTRNCRINYAGTLSTLQPSFGEYGIYGCCLRDKNDYLAFSRGEPR